MQLRVSFSGLCAFVPTAAGDAMRVLVVDARDGATTKNSCCDGNKLHAHAPLLMYQDPGSGAPMLFNLHKKDLAFNVTGGTPNALQTFQSEVVQLHAAVPGLGRLKAQCLTGATDLVVARFTLKGGELAARQPVRRWDAANKIWKELSWKVNGTTYTKLASQVDWVSDNFTASVDMTVTSFGGSKLEDVTLEPVNGAQIIEVLVTNTCGGAPLGNPPAKDQSFRWFYELLEVCPGTCHVPEEDVGGAPPGPSNTLCPPVCFDAQ